MKKILAIVLIFVVIIALLHVALFAFINVKGKDLLVSAIKANTGLDSSIESLSLKFPFAVEVKGFKCKDLSVDTASASIGFVNPFTLKVIFNKILVDGLNVKVKKEKADFSIASVAVPVSAAKKAVPEKKDDSTRKASSPAPKKAVSASSKGRDFSLGIKYLRLSDSLIQFIDTTGEKPLEFSLKGADLTVRNFTYPRISKFYVKLASSLTAGSKEAKDIIKVEGWVDYLNKNMDVDFDVGSIDYFTFADYYPDSWDRWNSVIDEAKISLDSNLTSKNNDLIADCILTLDKIAFRELAETEENQEAISRVKTMKTVVAFLKGKSSEPSLHFKLKTRMDSPNLDFSSVKDNLKEIVFKVGPATLIGEVIDRVKDKVKNGKEIDADAAKEAVGSVVDIFKGIFKPSE